MSMHLHQRDSKKDKSKMVKSNNDKITRREFDELGIIQHGNKHRLNVDRIMLERQMTSHNFDNDGQGNDNHNGDNEQMCGYSRQRMDDDAEYVGEVTGDIIDRSDIFDKGMPLRSSFTMKQSKYDNNNHLDFKLYDRLDNKDRIDVAYNETSAGEYAGIDEAMKTITRGADPYEICVSDINSTTCWLYTNMFMFTNQSYVINGFGLFSIFGVIYLLSKGNTEIELKNYFGYQDKKHLNAGLLTIREHNNDFRKQFIMDNYIINNKDIPSNVETAKKLKSLIFNIVINKSYAEQEANRVNEIIKTVSKMTDVISANTLAKSNISLISVIKFNPIWAYKLDGVVKAKFHDKFTNYIRFIGKTFDYYEDTERQLIEIPMYGNGKDITFVVGFILSKKQLDSPIDLKALSTSINYIKPTVLNEVLIPTIRNRFKTRLNKTLQKTGLSMVFSEQEMIGLYPEGGTIDDCIQYIDLIFDMRSGNLKSDNKGYSTTRKFIANRSFEFYLRNIENNCILIMGKI
jgi:serine protease inhibitor